MKLIFNFLILQFIMCANAIAQNAEVNKKINLVEHNLIGPIEGKTHSIAERMHYFRVNGLGLAVIHNYKIEWAKGYGIADKKHNVPVIQTTLFQAGSISKSLNAVGVLKLVQEKKIDLYHDINDYLTTWKFPYDKLSKGKKITMANLLSHTAGLNVSGFSGYKRGEQVPSILQVLNGMKPANAPAIRSIFEPGLRYEYSGGGTIISQLILSDISNQSYANYMFTNVLKSLGMNSSSFEQPPLKQQDNLYAAGYYVSGKAVEGKFHIYPEQAAAGLWSTPSDIAKYIIAIQKAYLGKTDQLLRPDIARTMLVPYIDKRAALGVFIDDLDGERYFEHDGLTFGFYSKYYGSLKGGNGVVVMTNSVDPDIVTEITNSVAKVYGFKGLYRSKTVKHFELPDFVLENYAGRYQLAPGIILKVTKDSKQLNIQLTGQDKEPIFAETREKFYLKSVDAQLVFSKNKVVLYQDGSTITAKKINNK